MDARNGMERKRQKQKSDREREREWNKVQKKKTRKSRKWRKGAKNFFTIELKLSVHASSIVLKCNRAENTKTNIDET